MASEQLEQMIKCPICLCDLTEPRALLPCLHTFCLHCLEQLQQSNEGQICCPSCRKYSTIPRGGLKNLPVNFHLNELRDIKERLSNLRENGSEPVQLASANRTCRVHRDKAMRLYCVTCDMCVCSRCCAQNHHLHNRKTVNDAAGEKRETLSSIIMIADTHLAELMYSNGGLDVEETYIATITGISDQANNLLQSGDDVAIVNATNELEQRLHTWQQGRTLPLELEGGSQEGLPPAPRGGLRSDAPRCDHLFDFKALHGVAEGNTIVVIGDKLYIAGTDTIGVYLLTGECFSTLNTKAWKCVSGIAATPSGELLVADRGRKEALLMSTEGKVLRVFGKSLFRTVTIKEPVGVAATPDGRHVVVDGELGSLYVFKANGKVSEWIQKCFNSPCCVAVSDDNTLGVCEDDSEVTFLPVTASSTHSFADRNSASISPYTVRSLIHDGGGRVLYATADSVRILECARNVVEASDPCALGYHNGRLYVGLGNGTVKVFRYDNAS